MIRIGLALATAAMLLSAAVHAASPPEVVPALPAAFETVRVRMAVDSCAFDPSSVRVSAVANTVRVTQQLNMCLAPGSPLVVDVQLGAFPAGDYRVELYTTIQPSGTPAATLAFTVSEVARIAIVPAPPRPLDGYSGLWWTPAESGWGLSLHQSPTYGMFGALFAYDGSGEPRWFTFQNGRWTSFTQWAATVYRTRGPYFGGAFDPAQVVIAPVGVASIDFTQTPGAENTATLRYTVDGVSVTKTITRMRF